MKTIEEQFFAHERKQRTMEASGMPSLRGNIIEMLDKQTVSRKRFRIWAWITGISAFAGLFVFSCFYSGETYLSLLSWIERTAVSLSEAVSDTFRQIVARMGEMVSGFFTGLPLPAIEKATTEISVWPVQIWYVLALLLGIVLLVGADKLIRHKFPA